MKLSASAISVAAIALSGCVQPQSANNTNPPMPYELTASDRMAVSESVKGKLKDPESARFGLMLATRRQGDPIKVCGYVNAKNSFGGYTGNEIFLGVLTSGGSKSAAFSTTDISGQNDKFDLARNLCERDGVILPRL